MTFIVPTPQMVAFDSIKDLLRILLHRKDIDPLDAPEIAVAVHIRLKKQFNKAVDEGLI